MLTIQSVLQATTKSTKINMQKLVKFDDLDLRLLIEHADSLYQENKKVLFNSLHEGMGGYLMLNYAIGKLYQDQNLLDKANRIYQEIIDRISDGKVHDCHSFANGLPGICWLLDYYSQLTDNKSLVVGPEIEQLLKESAIKSFEMGYADPLYGGMGGLYYFIMKYGEYNEDIRDIFQAFYRNGKKDELGFRSRNAILEEDVDEEYDIGFAHGLAGYVSILSMIKSGTPEIDQCIAESLHYIEQQYREDSVSKYPASLLEASTSSEEMDEKYNIRIGWCYGDLSIATMYLHLYNRTGNKSYFDKALNLAMGTLVRRSRKLSHVNDIYFCHGSSYLYFIYNLFYKVSHEERFLKQSLYWGRYTQTHLHIEKELKKNSLSFLNGIIGPLFVWLYADKQILDKRIFQSYFLNI